MGEKRKGKVRTTRESQRTSSGRRNVFLLWHTDGLGDEKLIGVYEKRADASSAINRMKGKPGFSEKGAFEIATYQVNKDYWTEGFTQHEGSSLPTWFRPS